MLLEDNEPNIRERFYAHVEAMLRNKDKFSKILNVQPTVHTLIEDKHPDFLDYFREVELSLL